jgi:single-strand DNA-binding protein
MNKCIFGGRFVRKPELKPVSDTKVCNFSIAVNRKYTNQQNESKEEVVYIDCEIWDSGAETIARNCDKGDYILLECSAKSDSWTEADGKKRSKMKFRVDRFHFIPGTKKKQSEDAEQADVSVSNSESKKEKEEDIPF